MQPTPQSLAVSTEEAKNLARSDMNFFGSLALPEDVIYSFPEFYVYFWKLITDTLHKQRDFSRFALGLPRGHGKTFVVKLLILYVILFTKRKFILVVSSSADNAKNIVADVMDTLDGENIKAVFGDWRFGVEIDRQDKKKFIFCGRSIIIKAAGHGTSVRGIQEKNSRPDFIICDDVQDRESAESIPESVALMRWFIATLLKAKSPFGCTTLYVGNMYPDIETPEGNYTCILRNLQLSKNWTSLIVGGILEDGTALWEDLQPLEQLLSDFESDKELGQADIFYAEVLNSPQPGQSSFFDRTKVKSFDLNEDLLPSGSFVLIDPSGRKSTSDDTAMGYFEVFDATPVLVELTSEILTPKQTIERAIELCAKHSCNCIVFEDVAYQASLGFWLEEALQTLGMSNSIQILTVNPRGRPKSSRILTMFKQWQAGELRVSRSCEAICINQAIAYKPAKSNNIDNILDILAYAPEVTKEHPQAISIVLGHQSFEDFLFQKTSTTSEFLARDSLLLN